MSRRKKSLTEEDKTLWNAVRKTATPLHVERMPDPLPRLEPTKTPAPKVPREMEAFEIEIGKYAEKTALGHDLAPTISERLSQSPLRMDRKKFGKMRKGKILPEARIDLHGMTLAQAHPALMRFILNSWAMERRLVLVITGKGKHRDDDGPIPVRRGVLKHQVPHWLHTSPLREAVLQVSEAHLKHGGTGAYYVYLRRPK
ncbi:Smr/MutS family protein [Celeribacter persicus]|uniref:DNA-nicking Smr family endonuclease n=1 Tax=Celeribacter persicus TaxID=1651082 RepID=A0A2T5HDM5_9RHOB|nr:Smr/MutS family protein [Celeribacter persicus]PTQ69681.1 DNA-nicking Smr family endonuclease [Celeribacter persicus]